MVEVGENGNNMVKVVKNAPKRDEIWVNIGQGWTKVTKITL